MEKDFSLDANAKILSQLLEILEESNKLELKEKLNNSITKEIVSFLNSDGGTILIGISKDKKIIGVNSVDALQRNLSDIITDKISPRCIDFVSSHKITLDKKDIIQIDIKSDCNHLYYIKENHNQQYQLTALHWQQLKLHQ